MGRNIFVACVVIFHRYLWHIGGHALALIIHFCKFIIIVTYVRISSFEQTYYIFNVVAFLCLFIISTRDSWC